MTLVSTKSELMAYLTEATKEFTVPTLRGNSKDIYAHILEELEYNLEDGCDQHDAECRLEDCDCPDLDSWAPYYSQRSEIIKNLGTSQMNDCEDWLEEMYGNPFDGCKSFTDCEARMAMAAIELGFNEAKADILREVETFFEGRD